MSRGRLLKCLPSMQSAKMSEYLQYKTHLIVSVLVENEHSAERVNVICVLTSSEKNP